MHTYREEHMNEALHNSASHANSSVKPEQGQGSPVSSTRAYRSSQLKSSTAFQELTKSTTIMTVKNQTYYSSFISVSFENKSEVVNSSKEKRRRAK